MFRLRCEDAKAVRVRERLLTVDDDWLTVIHGYLDVLLGRIRCKARFVSGVEHVYYNEPCSLIPLLLAALERERVELK